MADRPTPFDVRLHPHARQRMRERGATIAEVIATVRVGRKSPAKFGRSRFIRRLPFDRLWNGKRYAFKEIEAVATSIAPKAWMVITIIVKFY